MRAVCTIAGREMRSLFLSPLFYVVAALCATLWSIIYWLSLQKFAEQSMMMMMQTRGEGGGLSLHHQVFQGHIMLVNFIMIVSVSALTMRLFAEEKRSRTYDLLMTSPITATEIVLGKLLGGLAVAWALVLVSALYPVSLALFAEIQWGPLASSYLGLLMLVSAYVGIGMFASSLTDHPVIAVVVSLILNIGIWFLGAGAEAAEGPVLNAVFTHLALGTHFYNFINGTISIASTIFMLSLVGMATFLTQRVVESSRWR